MYTYIITHVIHLHSYTHKEVTHIGSSLRKTYTYIIGTPYIYIHLSWIPQHPELEAIFLELEAIFLELEAILPELESILPELEAIFPKL